MSIVTASAISSLVGQKTRRRKFKLTGGRIMATRGKRMSSRRGSTKRPMTRGKKKKR